MNLKKFIGGVSALAIAASAFAAMTVTASADANTQVWDFSQYSGSAMTATDTNGYTLWYGTDNTATTTKPEDTSSYVKVYSIVNGRGLTSGEEGYKSGTTNYIKIGALSNNSNSSDYIKFTPAYTGTVTIQGNYFQDNQGNNAFSGVAATSSSKTEIKANCVAGGEITLMPKKNFVVQTITVTETEAEYVGTSWNFSGNSAGQKNLEANTFYKIATDGARYAATTTDNWETGVLYVKPTSDSNRTGQIGIVEDKYSSALKVRGDFEIDYTPSVASCVTINCNYNTVATITDYVKVVASPSSTASSGTILTYYVPANTRLQLIGGSGSDKAVSIKSITVTPATGSLTQIKEDGTAGNKQFDSDVDDDSTKAKAGIYTVPASANTVSVGIGSKIQSKDVSSYNGDVVIGVIMTGTSSNLPAVSELTVVVE